MIKDTALFDLYDLVHPLFLNSMGELGTENLVLPVLKKNPGIADKELITKCGVSKGTFYKYKKILRGKGLILRKSGYQSS